MSSADLNQRIETGLRWSVVRQLILAFVGTAAVLAYTRLLEPGAMGQFTIATIVYSGLYLLIQAPIRDAVIYFREDEQLYESSAFWLLLGFSTAATVAALLLAAPLANYYEFPQAAGLTRGMVIAFWFQALSVVPAALLLKRFSFAQHEMLLVVAETIFSAGVIGLLLLGFGAWSLVIPAIVRSIFWAGATWRVTGFRPLRRIAREIYVNILRYSRNIAGTQFLIYLNRNIDNAAVGRLGDSQLGLYSFGEGQSSFVVLGVGIPVSQITLPALASLQKQPGEFRRIYLEMLRLTASLATPSQIGAIVLAPLIIIVFFGEQWLPATAAMQGYLVYRILQTLLEITDAAMSAVGRPDERFKMDLLQLPIFVGGTWLALTLWGSITAVAWTLATIRASIGLVYLAISLQIAHTSLADLWRYLWPSTAAALVMGIVVYLGQQSGILGVANVVVSLEVAPSFGRNIIALITLILAGFLTYIPTLYLLDRSGTLAVGRAIGHIVLPVSWRKRILNFRQKEN